MKKAAVLLLAFLLAGCSATKSDIDRAMTLRTNLLEAQECSFTSKITADYGDNVYSFAVHSEADHDGNLTFSVAEPESISGICGKISQEKGYLTFDSSALALPLLADDQVTPISAPWLFLKTLRSGYITSAGADGEYLRLSVDDSFADDPLHLDIWIDRENLPVHCEILYREHKILSLDVTNFQFR